MFRAPGVIRNIILYKISANLILILHHGSFENQENESHCLDDFLSKSFLCEEINLFDFNKIQINRVVNKKIFIFFKRNKFYWFCLLVSNLSIPINYVVLSSDRSRDLGFLEAATGSVL